MLIALISFLISEKQVGGHQNGCLLDFQRADFTLFVRGADSVPWNTVLKCEGFQEGNPKGAGAGHPSVP